MSLQTSDLTRTPAADLAPPTTGARSPRPGRRALTMPAWVVPAALIGLILAACWVRAAWSPAVQGTMGRDEARLALAARGILEYGVPRLPDGFLYTRGLLPAYVEAASIGLLGVTDQAARLPSLVFGTLLVPAVYSLARLTGGSGPALAAAAIVAFSPPLVLQAREAWLYSSLLLWFTLALAWLRRDGPGDRWRAGLAALAALFSHELAVLLVPIAALLDFARLRRDLRRRAVPDGPRLIAWRPAIGFWLLLLGGVAVVGALSLGLRSSTLGGATSEVREYLQVARDLSGLSLTVSILGGWYPWLLPATVLGLPFTPAGLRAALARPERAVAPLVVLAVILFNAFGLVRRGESRYVLLAVPALAVAATNGLARVGPPVVAALGGLRLGGAGRTAVRVGLLAVLVLLSLEPSRLVADADARNVPSTWVQAVADRRPDDLIVSFAPTLTSHYLGRTDYWLRSEGYAKYVWADRRPLRDVHTGAVVIRDVRELESLLTRPNGGRTAWVILATDPDREPSRPAREVAQALLAAAAEVRRPPDGRVVVRVIL